MDFSGYMITGHLTDTALHVAGSNKVSRAALATQARYRDVLEVPDEVVIPLGEVTGLQMRSASMVTNGRLTIGTIDGDVQLHYRRKSQAEFDRLAAEVAERSGVTVTS